MCIERFLETSYKRYIIGLVLSPILLANCHAALFPVYLVIFLPYIEEYLITFITKKNFYKLRIKYLDKKIIHMQKRVGNKKIKDKKIDKYKENITNKQLKLENIKSILKVKETIKDENDNSKKIIIERNKNGKWLILIFIVCIFTGLLTPLGDIPYTYMIKSIEGNTMHFIAEHQSVALIHDYSLLFILAIMVVLLFSNKIKIKLRDVFMLSGMTILALISYKQFPIFFIATMCIINKLIIILVNSYKEKRIRQKETQNVLESTNKNNKKRLITKKKIINKIKELIYSIFTIKGIIYATLVITIISLLQYKNIASQSYVDSNSYPTNAAKWIKENIDIENMRLFNDFNYGSYLLFQDIPVFIDGRADVYDPVFNGRMEDSFLDYMQASSLQVWYEEIYKKYDITHIITTVNSNLNKYMQRSGNYRVLYNDGAFIIYQTRFAEIQAQTEELNKKTQE